MKSFRIKNLEDLKRLIGVKGELKLYLLGQIAILAKSQEDVEKTLEAISLPSGLSLKVIKQFLRRPPAISINEDEVSKRIIISDISSSDLALVIANHLAAKLSKYSPFIVRRIDCIITYRASEDGGFTVKNQVEIVINKNISDQLLRTITSIVENSIQEFLSEEGK